MLWLIEMEMIGHYFVDILIILILMISNGGANNRMIYHCFT